MREPLFELPPFDPTGRPRFFDAAAGAGAGTVCLALLPLLLLLLLPSPPLRVALASLMVSGYCPCFCLYSAFSCTASSRWKVADDPTVASEESSGVLSLGAPFLFCLALLNAGSESTRASDASRSIHSLYFTNS